MASSNNQQNVFSVSADELRERRLRRRRERERAHRAAETATEQREKRLQRRRERERAHRATETAEEREQRLAKRRAKDRARRAAQTEEQRQDCLQRRRSRLVRAAESTEKREDRLRQMRIDQHERRAVESTVEREDRLRHMRIDQRERRADESTEEREDRLRQMRIDQYARRAVETIDHRDARLLQVSANQGELYATRRDLPYKQHSIQLKIRRFHDYFATYNYSKCSTCLESFPGLQLCSSTEECMRCSRDTYIPKVYSSTNNMNPGLLPLQLQNLTQVEEMLISAVLPIMSLYKLPHGQYAYSGHIINLPQDVASFANSLPRLPSELDVVIVRKEGAVNSHRDFRVRRAVVLHALQWLVVNNKYYHNIHINLEAVATLPEDSDLNGLHSVSLDSTGEDTRSPETLNEDDDPYDSHLSGSFVPSTTQRMTEQETVRQSVHQRQSHQLQTAPPTVSWPPCGSVPINEFNTEGYMSRAFPTLFPTGAADFLAPRPIGVTIGNYFKHMMMYEDGRFARHPRFRFFALNTEMRWRALQAGRIYVRQHPHDAQLSVEELRDMVGREGEIFSNHVLHYATSLRGTRQYWFKQRSRLIAMVDTLGLPTIFFTHSAADLQWPELARLICPENSNSSSARCKAVQENPAIADWFFYQRIVKFIDVFYVGVLGATDYWFRFEWQHRGSPHVHGIAWLPDAPDVQQVLNNSEDSSTEELLQYIDKVVSTTNPAILPDGSNADEAPLPKTNPHICNRSYSEVEDFDQDLTDLIATCQRHTRCSAAYCLQSRNGQQKCRYGFPKPLQPETALVMEDDDPVLLTVRNDGLINSYNPVQLSAWRANVDIQYCVSRRKVIEYCAKYATKSEPRSQSLKEIFATIVKSLKEDNSPLKAVQKLLINSVGERDVSAQETCHLLLQLPLFKASRDFIVLSLDGSRAVDEHLHEDQPATVLSALDHYVSRPTTAQFQSMTLLHFVQHYTMPKKTDSEPSKRRKEVVVIVRPYCSPDPQGPNYEQYCQQKLMLHVPFRHQNELFGTHTTFTAAYADFLQSGNIPPSLEDDIYRLQELSEQPSGDEDIEDQSDQQPCQRPTRAVEEWMLICQSSADLQPSTESPEDADWTTEAQAYSNVEEMPTFISRHREAAGQQSFTTSADPQHLQSKQLQAYNIVREHAEADHPPPLRLIVSGTAGTGKSYLINCLRLLLNHRVRVAAPTGVAAFNIDGHTLHSLFSLPVKGDFKELQGERLHQMQQSLANMEYLIIDEMSMVGRKLLGQIDQRLRQVFPHQTDALFGGCSCLLFGDFGQLPPVMDLPLYTTVSRSPLSDAGSAAYQLFDRAIVLKQVMRQSGQDSDQVLFRDILLRLRNARLTISDWERLMKQTPAEITDLAPFINALQLHPTIEAVVEHNVSRLRESGHPIATIKAVHSGPNASKASSENAGGLESIICLACDARIMLTSNLWVDIGLVNGAMGTVAAICYRNGESPPNLPVAVTVKFDSYRGPTLPDGTVPITPLRRTWSTSAGSCSRLQLPLKLAWAVTIHKAQGLTLDKVVIDVGKKEFSAGLTFVACSRVRHLKDLLFDPPFPFQRVANLANSQRLQERLLEDAKLLLLDKITLPNSSPPQHFQLTEDIHPIIEPQIVHSETPSPPTIHIITPSPPIIHSATPSPPIMHSVTPRPPMFSTTLSPPIMHSTTPSPHNIIYSATLSQHMYSENPSSPLCSSTPSPPIFSVTPSPPIMHSATTSPSIMYSTTPSPPIFSATPSPPVYSATPSPLMYSTTPSPPIYCATPSPPILQEKQNNS